MDLTNIFKKILQCLKKYHFSADHYKNREIALLTQHGKESVLAPLLKELIGCTVTKVEGYDTDLLGTFSRDIPRLGTQVETARKKARIGMEISGLKLGLASEGSFGADSFTGMFSRNFEVLIWVDDESDLEIIASSQGKTNLDHLLASTWDEVEVFAQKAGFPEHYLIIRPENENDKRIIKDITTWDELQRAFDLALKQSKNKQLFIETDMRAHANPTRMENIRLAAEELARKLSSCCPECGSPGYWVVERVTGLPCSRCGTPTHEIRADVYGCCKCSHRSLIERTEHTYADPGHCDRCNP